VGTREGMDTSVLDWHRASLCQNGECVEIAMYRDEVVMRNSAEPNSGNVFFTPEEFGTFLKGAKAGSFDVDM
jgi:Domain of unknown function (DUF397)